MYSKIVKDHFQNPRNACVIDNPSAMAEGDNPVCGDIMKIFLRVDNGTIRDVGIQTRGCPAAIAAGSVLSELLLDGALRAASTIDADTIIEALGGLPRNKRHAGDLAADVLRAALGPFKE